MIQSALTHRIKGTLNRRLLTHQFREFGDAAGPARPPIRDGKI